LSERKKAAVLISGRGSNMSSLIEAAKADNYPADIALVISNRPAALGLEVAKAENIVALAIDHTDYDSREDFEDALHKVLVDHDIAWFNITMDQAQVVGVVQGAAEGFNDSAGFRSGEQIFPSEGPPPQGGSRNKIHQHKDQVLILFQAVKTHYVGMLKPG